MNTAASDEVHDRVILYLGHVYVRRLQVRREDLFIATKLSRLGSYGDLLHVRSVVVRFFSCRPLSRVP